VTIVIILPGILSQELSKRPVSRAPKADGSGGFASPAICSIIALRETSLSSREFPMKSEAELRVGSLVLYKNRPGRVNQVGPKKIEIALNGGETLSVRPKDVELLHPGPLASLAALQTLSGEVKVAWELLVGSTTTLVELAELAYGAYSPNSAWSAWQLVNDGLYFSGSIGTVAVHPAETVAAIQAERAEKAAEEKTWQAFAERMARNQYDPADDRYLQEVVAVAWEQKSQSRVLSALGLAETAANAHALLLRIGYWHETDNPYPRRAGLTVKSPNVLLPDLPDEPRRDLTHLLSLAIDDTGSQDPDDALSLGEDGRLWVHVADVAALIKPGGLADQEAQARGANLYLPEGTVPMLPAAATARLGLGLNEISPAFSFGLTCNEAGEVVDLEMIPSWIRVSRLTYAAAEERLHEEPFNTLYRLAQKFEARRYENGAVRIDLPEIKIRAVDGQIVIEPLAPLRSRDLVREAMLMTGEAVARLAIEQGILLPFTSQAPSKAEPELLAAETPSQMFALRRTMQPGQQGTTPGPHAGLGLPVYVQVTSPLRRYLDLVAHQQLRAFLSGRDLLSESELVARIGAFDAVSSSVRRTERLSNTHWTLVYLKNHPDWAGEGIVIEKRPSHDLVLISDLALEVQVYGKKNTTLDQLVQLQLTSVNLPELEARFRYLS
jgi:exoribonuclease II